MTLLTFFMIVAIVVLFVSRNKFRQQVLYRIEKLENKLRSLEGKLTKEEKEPEVIIPDPLPVPPVVPEPAEEPVPETASKTDREKWYEPPAEPYRTVVYESAKTETKTEPEVPAPSKESELASKWREFKKTVDWELFTGKKLFAWLGGLSLFIAVGLFMKFSIDRNLIPMALRLTFGGITGIALILLAQRFKTEKYKVLCHTFVSGGIGVLYSIVYASFLYGYLNQAVGFGMLALVSSAAFVMAVYHKGLSISILGAVGAYLTPVLISTGSGNILMLFMYLSVVNIGLYQVVRYLKSDLLLLVAAVGTSIILALAVFSYFDTLSDVRISSVWSMNLALFSAFLWFLNKNPDEHPSIKWTGILVYLSAIVISLMLLNKSGWGTLLAITISIYGAIALAYRNKGWYSKIFLYCSMTFAIALLWAVFNFTPQHLSLSFVIFLLFGVASGFGPILLVQKYGINTKALNWFKIFPCAFVGMSLLGFIHGPDVSFWFWPLALTLQLGGIIISLLFAAFIQVGLLVFLLVGGGLYWIFSGPPSAIGYSFFVFLLVAGLLSCYVIYIGFKRLPEIIKKVGLGRPDDSVFPALPKIKNLDQWLTAAPVLSLFLLLAAAFSVNHPYLPHAGMVTMACFLGLILFLSARIQFQPPTTIGLLAAVFAQAVWILNPKTDYLVFSGVAWSFSFFGIALLVPFILYKDSMKWKQVFNAWALFEVFQGIFAIYSAFHFWNNDLIKWLPLGLAACKLPGVIILLKRLEGKNQRNSILAFHGGTLLFYISMLPILVLDHGWIGLTLVFEAVALLWLNRRIMHPGLRWVALCMAPTGLAILLFFIPDLKGSVSQPFFNMAILAVFLSLVALAGAVKWSSFPERMLGRLDLHNYFLWLLIGTGFYFLNLIIADIFGGTSRNFKILPGRNFIHSMSYGLTWAAFGAMLWKIRGMNMVMRFTGFAILCFGAIWLIGQPIINPDSIAMMPPLFNISLAAFLSLIGLLLFIYLKEPWDQFEGQTKNIFLAVLLAAGLMFIETGNSTLFQTGMKYVPLLSQTWPNALASSVFWMIYGLFLLLWPKRLDRPFRLAGFILIFAGIAKGLVFPFRFRTDFAGMTPILNFPTLIFLFIILSLIYLTLRDWKEPWPFAILPIRPFWGLALGIASFIILNIEIASAFAIKGRMFSMMSHGSLAMQLAYSIGWMLFAVVNLSIGIKWDAVRVRWAGIILLVVTSIKIFILDLWKLGQLYMVGSFVGLAVVLILVSFLYQRFLSEGEKNEV